MQGLKRPAQPELDAMSPAEKDALILLLFDLLEGLECRLKALEGKVEKDSRNPGKPPSSDGLKKQPAEPRKKGEKPVGGASGHPGATRALSGNPDAVVELRPQGVCECGRALDGLEAFPGERRRQVETPRPRPPPPSPLQRPPAAGTALFRGGRRAPVACRAAPGAAGRQGKGGVRPGTRPCGPGSRRDGRA